VLLPVSQSGKRHSLSICRFSFLFLIGNVALAMLGYVDISTAQTPLPFANWQYSTGEVLAPLGGPLPELRITLGGGTLIQPNFEGARRYELEPSGIIDVRYRDIAFLSDGEGLGINLLRGQGFRAGIAVSYDLGRDSHDDPRLHNLTNINPALEPKIFAQYFLLPIVFTADLRKGIGGHAGLIGDIGAYVPLPIAPHAYLFLGPSVTAANDRYMRSYFGVSTAEAASSGLPQFAARGGVKNATFGATAVWLIGEHWLLVGEGAFERLLGDAAASPIPQTRTQLVLGLDIGYRF
jgi:outer membrane scaffolding protein for murein synthesis (MipA/OmpV family)